MNATEITTATTLANSAGVNETSDSLDANPVPVAVVPVAVERGVRRRDERGEGVISLAIGVLIVALLGVVMYGLFESTMTKTSEKTDATVAQIGG